MSVRTDSGMFFDTLYELQRMSFVPQDNQALYCFEFNTVLFLIFAFKLFMYSCPKWKVSHWSSLLFICCWPLQMMHSKFGVQIKVVKNGTVLLVREDGRGFPKSCRTKFFCWLRDFVSPTNRNMLFNYWFSGLKNFVEKDFIWNLSVYMIRLFRLNLDFTRWSHMHRLSH